MTYNARRHPRELATPIIAALRQLPHVKRQFALHADVPEPSQALRPLPDLLLTHLRPMPARPPRTCEPERLTPVLVRELRRLNPPRRRERHSREPIREPMLPSAAEKLPRMPLPRVTLTRHDQSLPARRAPRPRVPAIRHKAIIPQHRRARPPQTSPAASPRRTPASPAPQDTRQQNPHGKPRIAITEPIAKKYASQSRKSAALIPPKNTTHNPERSSWSLRAFTASVI